MRYTQEPYQPSNTGSIAELLLRSGQVQSDKLQQLAQVAAQSQQQQGEAYSNLARNLGQIGSNAVGNFIDLKANEQKNKIAQQELAQRQQVNEAQIAASQSQTARNQFDLTQAQKTVADEASLKEKNRIATKIAAGLRDPDPQKREVVLGIIQDPETQDIARKMLLGRDKQNADYRAARAQFAAANGYDDDMVRIVVALDPMDGALAHFDKATNGGRDKAAVKQYVDAFWKKPEADEFVTGTPGGTVYNKRTGEVGATLPGPEKVPPQPTTASLAAAAAAGDPRAAAALKLLRPPTKVPVDPNAPPVTGISPNTTGQDVLSSLDAPTATLVKAYAEGRKAFPSGRVETDPYFKRIIALVGQYDPDFDTTNYNARSKARADFTSGKSAQTINALNTVIGHLGDLATKSETLNNTSSQTYNELKNFIKTKFGDKAVPSFNLVKKGVADELTRTWRQSGGTEGDIASWKEGLDAAESPEQLTDAFKTISEMLESKLSASENQRDQALGRFGQNIAVVTPKSRAILDRLQGLAPAADAAKTGAAPAGTQKIGRFEVTVTP